VATNKKFLFNKKSSLSAKELFKKLIEGDISALSQAITLIESDNSKHWKIANELITLCDFQNEKSLRIGITGVPGVGKSTFIETFGKLISQAGKKLAVLAIDPSSKQTGGSILGDKTRMEDFPFWKNFRRCS